MLGLAYLCVLKKSSAHIQLGNCLIRKLGSEVQCYKGVYDLTHGHWRGGFETVLATTLLLPILELYWADFHASSPLRIH